MVLKKLGNSPIKKNVVSHNLYPKPLFLKRDFNESIYKEAISSGIDSFQAYIIANRKTVTELNIHPDDIMNPSLGDLNVWDLKDMDLAADVISDAIINNEKIALLCDFDVDGISSAAVLYSALNDYFNVTSENIIPLISNRMLAGYGFSDNVIERIFEYKKSDIPTLLITADQGSKDGDRVTTYIEKMKKKKIKANVVITDHHHIGEKDLNNLHNAKAVVNPQRKDSKFKDNTICGCTVALFTMVAVREKLIEKGYLEKNAPKLTKLLTYSTAATIADCVSMASPINRAIVNKGMVDIDQGILPAWVAVKEYLSMSSKKTIRSSDVAFGIAPLINACSRTGGDGLVALKFYLATTLNEAKIFLSILIGQNEQRKNKEKELVKLSTFETFNLLEKKYNGLAIYLEEGHHGIHGIAASRICERFGKPVIIFSPHSKKDDKVDIIAGSARSVNTIDIHECLEYIQNKNKDIMIGFGGHSAAAGMKMKLENFEKFQEEFNLIITEHVEKNNLNLVPKIYYDGVVSDKIDNAFLDNVIKLEPFGNNFENPIFKVNSVYVENVLMCGVKNETARVVFKFKNFTYSAFCFRFYDTFLSNVLKSGNYYNLGISVSENIFNGVRSPSIVIVYAENLNEI